MVCFVFVFHGKRFFRGDLDVCHESLEMFSLGSVSTHADNFMHIGGDVRFLNNGVLMDVDLHRLRFEFLRCLFFSNVMPYLVI